MQGGHMVYYGNPVEAAIHFKEVDNQVNASVGECPVCGNVNPELIFNIIEARQVDEFGNYTDQRKISPAYLGRNLPEEKRSLTAKARPIPAPLQPERPRLAQSVLQLPASRSEIQDQ